MLCEQMCVVYGGKAEVTGHTAHQIFVATLQKADNSGNGQSHNTRITVILKINMCIDSI